MPDGGIHHLSNSLPSVTLNELLEHLSKRERDQKGISSATGTKRANIKAFVEENELHKGAVADIAKIHEKPTTQRADYMRSFLYLFELMKPVWDKENTDMLDAAAKTTSGMEEDMDKKASP